MTRGFLWRLVSYSLERQYLLGLEPSRIETRHIADHVFGTSRSWLMCMSGLVHQLTDAPVRQVQARRLLLEGLTMVEGKRHSPAAVLGPFGTEELVADEIETEARHPA